MKVAESNRQSRPDCAVLVRSASVAPSSSIRSALMTIRRGLLSHIQPVARMGSRSGR